MAFPSFFIIFIIFILVFQHHLRKNNKIERKLKDEFWQKEESSLVIRKKEIPQEYYIHSDISSLSLSIPENIDPGDKGQVKQLIKRIKDLSNQDMMNFNQLSNTELRLKFGTANQSIITNNEYTYHNFLKTLASYASLMKEYDKGDESIKALELCISLGSDYSQHFYALGQLYLDQHMTSKLKHLKQIVLDRDFLNQKGILNKLESLEH